MDEKSGGGFLSEFLENIVSADSPAAAAGPDADLYRDLFASPFETVPATTKRGPGRPKGAKNRTTADMRRFIMANYRDPLLNLMDIVAMTPNEIAREFSLKRNDAADLWFKSLAKALEYLHQKQPTAVVVAGIQFHDVNINIGSGPAQEVRSQFEAGIKTAMNSIGYQMGSASVAESEVADYD